MRTYQQWMDEYGVSHQNHTNQMVHKVCVPLITLTVVGFLWCLPTPASFATVPFLNWATIGVSLGLIFYLTLNFVMFIGMLVQTFIMCAICHYLDRAGILLPFCIIVFVLAWIGQFWGHKIEGKKPSFLQDIVFLMIGPLWVTRFFYRWIGIKV